MTCAFVCHSATDAPFAQRLSMDLAMADITVLDKQFTLLAHTLNGLPGQASARSTWVILVETPTALHDERVRVEMAAACEYLWGGQLQGIVRLIAAPYDRRDSIPVWENLPVFDATLDEEHAIMGLLALLGAPVMMLPALRAQRTQPHPSVKAQAAPHFVPVRLRKLGFSGISVGHTPVILPPIGEVAGGMFQMGSDRQRDPQATADELPLHVAFARSCAIALYPVTVAEYLCAVQAHAASPPSGWSSQLAHPGHPVTQVTWQAAVDYAIWLAKLTGLPWRLPMEAEWEKAARWDERHKRALRYPWGDTWERQRANTRESGPRTMTPVGAYPKGASPYGIQEMAGNVWEWCSSLYLPYPYDPYDKRASLTEPGERVLRGGSYYTGSADARAARRGHAPVQLESFQCGFRLARDSNTPVLRITRKLSTF